jgi:hypothetical protein
VPSGSAQEAAAQIRQYLAEEENDAESEPAAFFFSTSDQAADPLVWRPVVLVILAGVASFVLGQRFSDPKDHKIERRPARDSLAAVVEAIGQPLATDPQVGKPRYRLSFDRRCETWSLDIDRDGNGMYDFRKAFQASGAPR